MLLAALAALAPLTSLAVTPCAEPRFTMLPVSVSSAAASTTVSADLNLDGASDLIALDRATGNLWAVRGRRDRDLGAPVRLFNAPAVTELYDAADVQGLGRTDLLVRTASGPTLLLGDGNGAIRAVSLAFDPDRARWAAADVNRDGFQDFVVTPEARQVLETYLGDGKGLFRRAAESPIAVPFSSLGQHALADVDGDGTLDALVTAANLSPPVERAVLVMHGDGFGSFSAAREVVRLPQSEGLVGGVQPADFDGDGLADLLISISVPGRPYGSIAGYSSYGDGHGSFTVPERREAGGIVVDVDSDGRQDIIGQSTSCFSGAGPCSNATFVERALPGRRFERSALPVIDPRYAADLDGDGLPDLVPGDVSDYGSVLMNTCGDPTFTKSFVIPAVLATRGASGAPFTSELVLTNRGATEVEVELIYTAAAGGGSGSGRMTLSGGRQRIVPDVIAELRALGVPIGPGESHVGSLRVRFSGMAYPVDVAASSRVVSPYGGGEVGVGVEGTAISKGLVGSSSIALLRETENVRTNLALVSLARPGEGDLVLRLTLYGDSGTVALPEERLAPGQFVQLDRVLSRAGMREAWCRIESVGGEAAYVAYAVLTDSLSGDGAVVPALHRAVGVVSVAAETDSYSTELIVTNTSGTARDVVLSFRSSAGFSSKRVNVPAGAVVALPSFASAFCGGSSVCAGRVSRDGYPADGLLLLGLTRGTGAGSRFGVAVPDSSTYPGAAVWLDGLRQDARHRTNIGLNVGGRYRIEVFDGDTGALATTVDDIWVSGWVQLSSFLAAHAPGIAQGYARVTRTDPTGLPGIVFAPEAYAVLNDGGAPGLGTGDGTFIAPK